MAEPCVFRKAALPAVFPELTYQLTLREAAGESRAARMVRVSSSIACLVKTSLQACDNDMSLIMIIYMKSLASGGQVWRLAAVP
jgi:hypothetical protein